MSPFARKKKPLSEEQKKANVERLNNIRSKRS
jgi:hypothetical protein